MTEIEKLDPSNGLGKTRRKSLRGMADRIDLLTHCVAALIQSQILGVVLAKDVRIRSDQMHGNHRQFSKEQPEKAPGKMILPMALLTIPSLMFF